MPPYPSIEYSEDVAGTYILRKMFVKKYQHSIHGLFPSPTPGKLWKETPIIPFQKQTVLVHPNTIVPVETWRPMGLITKFIKLFHGRALSKSKIPWPLSANPPFLLVSFKEEKLQTGLLSLPPTQLRHHVFLRKPCLSNNQTFIYGLLPGKQPSSRMGLVKAINWGTSCPFEKQM